MADTVMALDMGITVGWAVLGDGVGAVAGNRNLKGTARQMGMVGRKFDALLRDLILRYRPTVICFATPFVGQIYIKPRITNGKKIAGRYQPISSDTVRPLLGLTTVAEMICDELHIRAAEVEEPDARRAFLTGVPRKRKDIKAAVMRACELRGWPVTCDHEADAFCVASHVLEQLHPGRSHELTPLFMAVPARQAKKSRREPVE